jgi:hypothetical protein
VSDQDSADDESKLAKELIEGGSDIAGAATGAAIGLVGGPAGVVGGAVAGAALGRVLKRVGAEIRRRILSPREELRIGAAAAFAGEKIVASLGTGREPRTDGFFDDSTTDRSAAEELLEGVLLKARDAYEEKKLRYLGNLYANLAFAPQVSPAHGNHLIALAGRLTYRQLVALAVAGDENRRDQLRHRDFRDDQPALDVLGVDGIGVITELYELYQQGLMNGGEAAWISVADVNPGEMRAQGSGRVLATLMELETVPIADRQPYYRLFPASDHST